MSRGAVVMNTPALKLMLANRCAGRDTRLTLEQKVPFWNGGQGRSGGKADICFVFKSSPLVFKCKRSTRETHLLLFLFLVTGINKFTYLDTNTTGTFSRISSKSSLIELQTF